jgi:hypothetical protein
VVDATVGATAVMSGGAASLPLEHAARVANTLTAITLPQPLPNRTQVARPRSGRPPTQTGARTGTRAPLSPAGREISCRFVPESDTNRGKTHRLLARALPDGGSVAGSCRFPARIGNRSPGGTRTPGGSRSGPTPPTGPP